ncbi:Negative transcriptional regulator-copper transport operon [Leuconostoc pseudomesenteroides PS12]|nr:Negative transcriptional regulator-copper transport operon [Leuconostoc pseudomesenteroides 1159]KDA49789.1 Negative transcriptional regulator-copper transport operon [Leuconostoc pseudomesenteroides PS12]CCJ67121.1 Negative transcriptional regulator-copper transport operon [Leuconostoc pseudomesenteroides 4882]
MRVIWTLGEATSNQIIRILCAETDWQPSTVKTLITRLIKKGIISHNGAARDRIYTATITEKVAMVDPYLRHCTTCVPCVLVMR